MFLSLPQDEAEEKWWNAIEWEREKNFNNHSTADPSGRSSLLDERQALKFLLVCICLSNFVLIIIARHIVTVFFYSLFEGSVGKSCFEIRYFAVLIIETKATFDRST